MRFAIFSDIHANLQAWEAVLADIRSQAVDTLVCLGDVVGYGPMPGPVLESVYQHTDNFVLGNHDAVVGGRIDAGTFNQHARYVIQWTADQLGDEGAAFFAQVPLTLRGEKMLFTHGDAARPGHFDYVVKAEDSRPSFQACKDEVIFFGHTHDPCVFACANNRGIIDKLPGEDLVLSKGRRYMVNPGSVGDPRSANDLRGSYCIYDDTTRRLTFRKVEFDAEAYRADLKASGLEMLPYFLRVIDAGSRRPEEEDELAVVADHREAVEVDETMTAQPRALVTVGSPMANRAKLHFGYAPQRPQPYQAAEQYRQAMPHTRQLHQAPMPPKKRNGTAVLIVGMLLGVIALIWAMGYSSEPSKEDLGDLGGHVKKKQSPMLSKEDGWEEAAPEPKKVDADLGKPTIGTAIYSGSLPVFSLSALEDKPFEKYGIEPPDRVSLVDTPFGGKALHFAPGARELEVRQPSLGFGGSISVAAWVKLGREKHDRQIFRKGNRGAEMISLTVRIPKGKKTGCVFLEGRSLKLQKEIRTTSTIPVDDGEWHFILAVFDQQGGRARVYIDGKVRPARPCPGALEKSDAAVVIGGGDFLGEIYGLRVFDRVVGTAEMQRIHARRK